MKWEIDKLPSRNEIPLLLEQEGLTNLGVEVGVDRGDFSEYLLRSCSVKVLYSVDTWGAPLGKKWQDEQSTEEEYQVAREKLAAYGERSVILREVSVVAAQRFPNLSLDWVYIDGGHTFQAVSSDIGSWWPKVKSGGIVMGHDHNLPRFNGVSDAVESLVIHFGLELYVTAEDWSQDGVTVRSWLVRKP